MDNSQVNFKRGAAALVVLAVLREGDMYGYQLVQSLLEKSGGRFVTQEGSLYPVLYKLEDQGFVSSYRVKSGKRMTRVYYHLEPEGIEALERMISDYTQVTAGVLAILGMEGDNERQS
ncbi:MAG: PadR family transcriptional regulator [Oscillospiraceae bacterium]